MRKFDEAGFTLVEVLAAMAVFSIAALGLVRASSGAVTGAAHADLRFLAEVEAGNRLAELHTLGTPPQPGAARGESEQRGQKLAWTRLVAPTDRDDLVSVQVSVENPETGQVLATIETLMGTSP